MASTSDFSGNRQDAEIPDAIRAVTDNEVAFFDQNGWVLLRGLVKPALCRTALEHGKPRLADFMKGNNQIVEPAKQRKVLSVSGTDKGLVSDIKQWVEWRGPVRSANDPVFAGISVDKTMGRNVRRLLRRDRPVRIYHDIFVCKLQDRGSTRTSWHQDSPNFPLDRNALTIWVALDEITPEMGPVQFFSGSHRCGMLGCIPPSRLDLMDEYPELARFAVSPPYHLQAGDATVHHGLTVHGASANNSHNPRWSYLIAYFPIDARYTASPNHDTDGYGLRQGYPIEHPSFTLIPD
jgi:hypothetical protein